jgi:hypothetical protein
MNRFIVHEPNPLEVHQGYLARATTSALKQCAALVNAWEREAHETNDLDGIEFWAVIKATIDQEFARRKRGRQACPPSFTEKLDLCR